MNDKVYGAGTIVFRNFKNGVRFLGLKGPKEIRVVRKGTWDFPKGTREKNEKLWDCAQRETLEEAGLFFLESDIIAGPYIHSGCAMYLIKTDLDPTILANPISGNIEHEGFEWLSINDFHDDCYLWLRPFIVWAKKYMGL
jgi:8-oxo-dGTP pyrophosphatase MutT (NUDIX family)